MKPKRGIKKDSISITINPEIMKMLNYETNNKSKLIEWLLLQHFTKIGKDIKNIMI